jgi:hypothetical protein
MNKYFVYLILISNLFSYASSMDIEYNQPLGPFQISLKTSTLLSTPIILNGIPLTKEILAYCKEEQNKINEHILLLNNDFTFIMYNICSLSNNVTEVFARFEQVVRNFENILIYVCGYSNLINVSFDISPCFIQHLEELISIIENELKKSNKFNIEDKQNLEEIKKIKNNIDETLKTKQSEFYEIRQMLFKPRPYIPLYQQQQQHQQQEQQEKLICRLCNQPAGTDENTLFEHIKTYHQDIISQSGQKKEYFKNYMKKIITHVWKKDKKPADKFYCGICLICKSFLCCSILQHQCIQSILNNDGYCKLINKEGKIINHKLGKKYIVFEE